MQKYYLLIFNDDWADEHNVPAQACMTETQYQKWLEQPTGKPNPKYEQQKAIFDENVAARERYDKLVASNYRNKGSVSQAEIDAAYVPYVNSIHDEPKKFFSGIHARLGNNGQDFGDDYERYEFCKDLVADHIVRVHEVPKEFFEVFLDVKLHDLSLCNIFEEDLASNVYEDEEDY